MDSRTNVAATLTLVSDFNISILGRYFLGAAPKGGYRINETPYGQVIGSLMGFAGGKPEEAPAENLGLVWVRAEAISAAFQKALGMQSVDPEECLSEVDFFADAVLHFAQRQKHCFVATFAMPADHQGYGLLDWRPGLGLSHLLQRLNLRLSERLESAKNVFLMDTERWLKVCLAPSLPKLWYAAKIPYANAVFQQAAADLTTALTTLAGKSRRLVLLDLDNTLWGGIVGENGWQGIRLGGHDHIGEAFKAFQEALKSLTRRGVQLALISKNEESTALQAIDTHPEMVLGRNDFAGWRINWQDKAQNILDLLEELRLGTASAVFIDDNPVERDRIRSALPDLLVPDWPEDPCFYVQALHRLKCFDTPVVSEEDRRRTAMYASDRSRKELREEVRKESQTGSMEDWLKQLGTRVAVEPVTRSNIARVDQLFNKTNQLNLTTRRLTGEEILAWADHPGRAMFACSVSDKFGDLGLTGIVAIDSGRGGNDVGNGGGIERRNASPTEEAVLADYILSCRVMGRKVEETLIHLAVECARRLGAKSLSARYLPTERNAPTLKVFRESGLSEPAPGLFRWDCALPYAKPESVALEFVQAGAE